jgi:alanine racemase
MINDFTGSPVFAEIDLSAFRHNMDAVKKLVNGKSRIIAVVKGDAYGHGADVIAPEALKCGAEYLAVARLNEAVNLRKSGIDAPILLFGQSLPVYADEYIKYNLTVSVHSFKAAEALSDEAAKSGSVIPVHVKADTGMGRLGMTEEAADAADLIRRIGDLPGVKVEGVYSHFANADCADKSHAEMQLHRFLEIKDKVLSCVSEAPLFHIANSAAVMEFPESHLDMVRPGIMLYGLYPSSEMDRVKTVLKPVMSLKSQINQIKHVGPGFTVSYGSTHVTDRESVIATVPAGYADGYSRLLSSKGEMLVKGKRAAITGRVCMDLTMLDVSHIPDACEGDEVVLFGPQGDEFLGADEIADITGTISYEVVSAITSRVPRVYINR